MSIHSSNINKSIDLNIIGTSNLVKICNNLKIKLIFFSTSYVYQGKKGNYNEEDPVQPWNNYGWSKLGAEAAVQMYKNSLIIRACMTEYPFVHKYAFSNMFTNFIYHKDFIKIMEKVLNQKGILNIGGKGKTVYEFAKKYNFSVKRKKMKKNNTDNLPLNTLMNLNKLNKILKKK